MEKRKIGSLEVSLPDWDATTSAGVSTPRARRLWLRPRSTPGSTFRHCRHLRQRSEREYLGRALKGRRDKVLIATKFGMKLAEGKEGAKPAYIRQAAEDSLRRLGTDHIDLYQIHQPDTSTPIADTLGALDELVKAGKVREIGVRISRRSSCGRRPRRQGAGRVLSACRTTTACCIASRKPRYCPHANIWGWRSCRISRWPMDC